MRNRFLVSAILGLALVLSGACGSGGGGVTDGGDDDGGGGGGNPPLTGAAARLQADVRALTETIGSRHVGAYSHLTAAAGHVEGALTAAGWTTNRQTFIAGGRQVWNVIGDLPGHAPGDPTVLVGAHYDCVAGSPGADDNASGVAVLLEIARRVATITTASQVRVVAFVNEEDPWFGTDQMGSQFYAESAAAVGADLRAVVNMDMIGYFAEGTVRALVGAQGSASAGLVDDVRTLFATGTTLPIAEFGGSDLADTDASSFWDQGFPCVVMTSPGWDFDDQWHEAGDTWDRLDYARMAQVVDGLVAAVAGL